ncbi:MAG: glycoside hydrolase family 127 protein [Faecalicatena sp.]|uniref:glycoside hydrolase family 127 protein n=1 Tax=Faecalicatena sp. TaxID=2005360 RepID=UPI002590DEDF|nr:beta-L-arabinofuranosidase domain-containing protein [Faecalicatena sp.]MCI6465502.1 glycoside hydrolase family 127 protein [Faecalicatena sp.]MDY5617334.1 glycoside hydrolase family 127 protein [Lachnospiraceae bacterium]
MKLHSVNLQKIKITDEFWSKHVNLVKDAIIPYQWDAMNDRIPDAEPSHCLENFAIAAGRKEGEFYGAVFQDTDIAKWLEAVGFTLAANKDPELEKTADEVIDLIAEAQQEDGYLDTYFIVKEPERRWKNLCEGHELYTAGHMMEAAVAYYQGTGKKKFLEVVLKLADLLCDTFGTEEGKIHGYPGHQEVEIGLIKLYQVTGEQKYLNLAKYFIDARGIGENYFLQEMSAPDYRNIFPEFAGYQPAYSQSDRPVREQEAAEGHAVRAVYMYSAMADLAYEYKDEELMESCERLWKNIVQKQMYITGGIGASGILERFTTDYDLPNDCNYAESCASIGLAMFGIRMANITKDASYIDTVERALYNTVLAGIALDGKSFFYVNPLEVWPDNCMDHTSKEHVKPVRQKWFGVACCPPNIARTLASLGQYIYSVGEKAVYVNLFVSNETEIEIGREEVHVSMETKFPFDSRICIKVKNVPAAGIKLALRIPAYAQSYQVCANGQQVEYQVEKGYAYLTLTEEIEVTVTFEAPAKFVRANPNVRADCGKTAIVKGPLVYCLEEADNGKNLSELFIPTDQKIEEVRSTLFGGIIQLVLKGKRMQETAWKEEELYAEHPVILSDVMLKAVPYAYWNNRGMGEMTVWVKELI